MKIQSLLQDMQYKQKRVLENLICHFQNIKREELRTSLDDEISENILNQINKAYDDFVIQKKPLEYVLGYVEFMDNQFKIDSRALIPRPETEYMIQAVNDFVSSNLNNLCPPDKEGKGRFIKHLPYNKDLTSKAKDLRNNMTKTEKKLWYDFLNNYRFKFTRQKPIDNYVVDFYCSSLWLVIEIDWDTHRSDEEIKYDNIRTKKLESLWLRIIRFTNTEIYENFEEVCKKIEQETPSIPLVRGTENILFDIWTGCGVLGLSVILHNPNFFQKAYLSEYIDETLSLAQENYEIFKPRLWDTKVNLVKSNLLDFFNNSQFTIHNSQLILVANLPYIPDETFDKNVGENVKNREPRPAFVWWDDGLDYYRQMFQQIFDYKIKPVMFLEMMTWQVDILRQEFWQKINFEEVKTFHFNIRIVKARLK